MVNGRMVEIEVFPPAPFPDELQPDDLHDDKLWRYQMMNWRLRDAKITESGETIDDVLKMNDDFGNLMQMFATNGALPNIPLTPHEEFKMLVEEKIPELAATLEAAAETQIVVIDKQRQQQIEAAKMVSRMQVADKYGEDVLDEPEERFFAEEYVEESNWWDE